MIPGLNWLNIALGAVPALLVAWLLHTVDVGWIEAKNRAALTAQIESDTKACEADKQITKEANDALQESYNTIAGKLAESKRVQPSRCIVPSTGKAKPSASRGKHAGQNGEGINTDWLRDYAAQCEIHRQERITLEKFIDDVWQNH